MTRSWYSFPVSLSIVLFAATLALWLRSLGHVEMVCLNGLGAAFQVSSTDGVFTVEIGDIDVMKYIRDRPSTKWGVESGWHSFRREMSAGDAEGRPRRSFRLTIKGTINAVSAPYWAPALLLFLRITIPSTPRMLRWYNQALSNLNERSVGSSALNPPRVMYVPLLAAFPVLDLYANNIDIVPLRSMILPLAVLTCATSILWLLFATVSRNRLKGALIAAVLLTFCFGYRYIDPSPLDEALADGEPAAIHWPVLAAGLLVVSALIVIITFWPGRLRGVTRFLNYSAVALAVLPIARIGWHHRQSSNRIAVADPARTAAESTADGARPDIYYIVLDAYARQDILMKHFKFDNSDFIDFLQARGFFVGHRSRPNYLVTYLSLASSLNFRYLDFIQDELDREPLDRTIPYRMIQDNEAARFLKQYGYRFIHFKSTWGATAANPFADVQVGSKEHVFHNEFHRALVETTPLRAWSIQRAEGGIRQHHLSAFANLKSIPTMNGAKFVLAHFILPHPPYVFDRNGHDPRENVNDAKPINDPNNRLPQRARMYIDQLHFVNEQIKDIVAVILSKSKSPPIIIIQSDHGPNPRMRTFAGKVGMEGRTAILNAIYLPGSEGALYETISPVNLYRVIFNHCFNASYDLLEDRTTTRGFTYVGS